MTSPRVYITDYVENPDFERAILGDALVCHRDPAVEVLLVWHEKIDAGYLEQFPNLRAVIRYGVGYDNLDLEACSRRGIIACNTPDYGVDEVSDTAIAMILSIARGLFAYDEACRHYAEGWQEHTLPWIRRGCDLTVGVIGAGRIGGSVLLKANALGMRTVFYDPLKPSGHEKTLRTARSDSLRDLLSSADLVSLHCPLNGETHGMVDDEFVSEMKAGASLINTARGKLLRSLDTLYQPLRSEHLQAAYLDVLPEEPPREGRLHQAWLNHEPWLKGRFVINPHAAYFSDSAYREMRTKAAENAKRVLAGLPPRNQLNPL